MLVDFYLIDNDLWWSACCNETGRYQALDMRAYIPNRGPWKARRVPQEWGPARYAAQVLTDLGNDRIRNLYIAAHGNNGELDLGGQESLRTDNVETCLKPLADVIDRPAQGWPNVEFMDCWVVSETEGHPKAAMGEADTDLCKSDKDQSPECSAMLLRVQKKLQGRFTGDPQGVGLRFMLKVANCLQARVKASVDAGIDKVSKLFTFDGRRTVVVSPRGTWVEQLNGKYVQSGLTWSPRR